MNESNLPGWVICSLRNKFSISSFVETGTLHGTTALLASSLIPNVHTIEIYPPMYEKAMPEVKHNKNIHRYLGSSVEIIPKILPTLPGPTMFYLDGHWCGFGERLGKECPVLEELALLSDRQGDVIIIDDARLFLAPPGPPHRPEEWPTIDEVVAAAKTGNRSVLLWFDSIIVTPAPLVASL
jgi:hypothetical protein